MPSYRLRIEFEEIGSGILYSSLQSISETLSTGMMTKTAANGTSDVALSMGTVTNAEVFLITANRALSWRLNAADTAITLQANRLHVLWGANQTAPLISNTSGGTATIRYICAGT